MWRADRCPAQVAPQCDDGWRDTGGHAYLCAVHGEVAASTGGRRDAPLVRKRVLQDFFQCGALTAVRHKWRHKAARVGMTRAPTPGSAACMARRPQAPGVAATRRA